MCCIELLVCMPRGSTVRSLIGGIEHTDALFDELREAGKEDKLRQWVGTPAFRNEATSNSSSCSTSWQRPSRSSLEELVMMLAMQFGLGLAIVCGEDCGIVWCHFWPFKFDQWMVDS